MHYSGVGSAMGSFFILGGTFIDKFIKVMPSMLTGTLLTLALTFSAIIVGVFLGLIIALGRISKVKFLNALCWVYIWIFRGTPLLMQIFFIFYALPKVNSKLSFDPFTSSVIALGLNSAAYLAEIIRAAIQSIDKGQMEAAKALGMSYNMAMFRVIVPQSYRRLIPPVGNEFIMLLKDSALVAAVGMTELLRNSRLILISTGDSFYFNS